MKHGKKLLFIEGLDGLDDDKEAEANRFAADTLVPPEDAKQLPLLRTEAEIRAFARVVGVAPGIVLGRMQHEELMHPSQMNRLKVFYTWTAETGSE